MSVRREAANRVTTYCWHQRQCSADGVHLGQCRLGGGGAEGKSSLTRSPTLCLPCRATSSGAPRWPPRASRLRASRCATSTARATCRCGVEWSSPPLWGWSHTPLLWRLWLDHSSEAAGASDGEGRGGDTELQRPAAPCRVSSRALPLSPAAAAGFCADRQVCASAPPSLSTKAL
jgi:hypothetical protein